MGMHNAALKPIFMHNLCKFTFKIKIFMLDKYDLSILCALQHNAHATHQTIAQQVHLSTSQVSRRVQRLEADGLISRYVALLNPQAVKLSVRAVTYVTLTRHSGGDGLIFEQEIGSINEVLECYSVAGESDYILHIVAPDLQSLSDSVLRRLTRIAGVGNIRSNIVLNCIKSTTALPLTHLSQA